MCRITNYKNININNFHVKDESNKIPRDYNQTYSLKIKYYK